MDATVALMRAQRNLLPGDLPAQYLEHMLSPRRRFVKDEYGRKTVVYVSRGDDDYFQAETYDLVATEVLMTRLEVERMQQPEYVRLADLLDFESSDVADLDNMEYRPGPREPSLHDWS